PPPCTGSTMTAAVSVSTNRSTAAGSSRGANSTSNGVRGKPYHLPTAPQVTAPAAAVRPCQPCSSATALPRPVILNASFSAFSLASAPLLIQNTVSSPRPTNFARL